MLEVDEPDETLYGEVLESVLTDPVDEDVTGQLKVSDVVVLDDGYEDVE